MQADFSACSGCGLCQLVCPVWHHTRDIRLTPHGRAKAMQNGSQAADMAASIDSCAMCGACDPVCPERIGLMDMMFDLRRDLSAVDATRVAAPAPSVPNAASAAPIKGVGLVLDQALAADDDLRGRVKTILGGAQITTAADNGFDLAVALESGGQVPAERLAAFLAPLRGASRLIVADGLLLRAMKGWLPGMRLVSLGEALSSVAAVRAGLQPGDLYMIESRAFHADYERLVKHYDALRVQRGCGTNLDLQRIAMPTTAASRVPGRVNPLAQARWILEGREFARIVVEDARDVAVFRKVTERPVIHIAELV